MPSYDDGDPMVPLILLLGVIGICLLAAAGAIIDAVVS